MRLHWELLWYSTFVWQKNWLRKVCTTFGSVTHKKSYGNFTHGARVLLYTEDPDTYEVLSQVIVDNKFQVTMQTWIREETGDVVIQEPHAADPTQQQYWCCHAEGQNSSDC